jgi:hypothetical protein
MSVTVFQNDAWAAGGFTSATPGGTLATLRIGSAYDANRNAFAACRAIVQNFPIQEASSANVMYTADGHIYLHVPGDKLGSVTVSGYTFEGRCYCGQNFRNGACGLLQWYRDNRVSNRNTIKPIEMTWGWGMVLRGYLASVSLQTQQIASHLYSFNLPMYLEPEYQEYYEQIADADTHGYNSSSPV